MSIYLWLVVSVVCSCLLLIGIACAECPVNTRIVAGQTTCVACEIGKVSQGGDAISCTRCPAGYRAGRGICEPCDVGTYSLASSDACLLCPGGTVAPSTAMPSCVACPVDQIPFGTIECKSCPLGYQVANDSLSCTPCPHGHARQEFNSRCTQCLAGSYSAFPGAIECVLCETGKVSLAPGALACEPCPVGYTSTPGLNETCAPCPDGTTSSGQGGECTVVTGPASPEQYRLSEGAIVAYSYGLATFLCLISVVGLLGQKWYDRLDARNRSLAS